MLIPALAKERVQRKILVSSGGVSAAHIARKFGFGRATSSIDEIWNDKGVETVFIATPHQTHAKLVCDSLDQGKHVFVEKPLAMTFEELAAVEQAALRNREKCLMVGFNRRFSPHTVRMKDWLRGLPGSKAIVITINAGEIPAEHWTQDLGTGGGRILGEACHFIDLARFLVGESIVESKVTYLGGAAGRLRDSASMQLSFQDGSIATIHYFANGHKSFPKERVEVFAGGDVLICENFRRSVRMKTGKYFRSRSQDKGHQAEVGAFIKALSEGGAWPIPLEELLEVSRITLQLAGVES